MHLLRYAPLDSSTYIKYDSGVLGRKPCIYIRLHLLATNPCEKCGLGCADLGHLVFLPSGDTALTKRARKHSTLMAVVIKWSRARRRYERQGLLVENQALDQAESECLADSEARAGRREREAQRRAELDRDYVEQFAQHVRLLFPNCPSGREIAIAEHACLKYSDRIGRSAAAKSYNEEAIRLAVIAHVRHSETPYTKLLSKGFERWEMR
jgi:hypothetical protein